MKLKEEISKIWSENKIAVAEEKTFELFKKWALEMVEDEKVGSLYDYWEGEAPYPTEVVADVKEDIIKLIEESTK